MEALELPQKHKRMKNVAATKDTKTCYCKADIALFRDFIFVEVSTKRELWNVAMTREEVAVLTKDCALSFEGFFDTLCACLSGCENTFEPAEVKLEDKFANVVILVGQLKYAEFKLEKVV